MSFYIHHDSGHTYWDNLLYNDHVVFMNMYVVFRKLHLVEDSWPSRD